MQYLRYAHGIASQYLEADLAEKLKSHLGIPEEEDKKQPAKKRAKENCQNEDNSKSKKARISEEGPTEDYSKDYKKSGGGKEQAMNSKQKALAKSASGSKSIMSFFGKK